MSSLNRSLYLMWTNLVTFEESLGLIPQRAQLQGTIDVILAVSLLVE